MMFAFDCLGDPAHPDLSFILFWIGVTVARARVAASGRHTPRPAPTRPARAASENRTVCGTFIPLCAMPKLNSVFSIRLCVPWFGRDNGLGP